MDELVVVVEEDGGAVEGGEPNGRDPNLIDRGYDGLVANE